MVVPETAICTGMRAKTATQEAIGGLGSRLDPAM